MKKTQEAKRNKYIDWLVYKPYHAGIWTGRKIETGTKWVGAAGMAAPLAAGSFVTGTVVGYFDNLAKDFKKLEKYPAIECLFFALALALLGVAVYSFGTVLSNAENNRILSANPTNLTRLYGPVANLPVTVPSDGGVHVVAPTVNTIVMPAENTNVPKTVLSGKVTMACNNCTKIDNFVRSLIVLDSKNTGLYISNYIIPAWMNEGENCQFEIQNYEHIDDGGEQIIKVDGRDITYAECKTNGTVVGNTDDAVAANYDCLLGRAASPNNKVNEHLTDIVLIFQSEFGKCCGSFDNRDVLHLDCGGTKIYCREEPNVYSGNNFVACYKSNGAIDDAAGSFG
jgi:hypothetical protein